jgi:transposase
MLMQHSTQEAVLSFDFSLDTLDVALRAPDDQWLIPHQPYTNNRPGFQQLKAEILAHLHRLDGAQLTAVGESTALQWWHAFYQISTDPDFEPFNPKLILLNPAHVKHFRKALPEEDKCDPKDPRLIDTYYRTRRPPHAYTFDERYLPLRCLTRAYHRLIQTLATEKAFCLTLVYLLASDYQRLKPFSDPFGVTSLHLLSEYPDIAAIADLSLDDLSDELNRLACGHLKDPDETARQLQQIAQDSYPLPDSLRPTVHFILQQTLDHIRFLEDQKKLYTARIEAELALLPEAELALAESGLGLILVAGCLSEIQDTQRFTTGQKYDARGKRYRLRTYRDGQASVAKMAGLWWPRHSSGRFQGQDRRLAHERNPHLRYWFVQAAYSLKRHQPEYSAYYQRKYHEATKHHHKRALLLTARKATRLIFALLHKGQQARLEEESSP